MNNKILKILHKHCTGSIDEQGDCYLPSMNFGKVAAEIAKLFEAEDIKHLEILSKYAGGK